MTRKIWGKYKKNVTGEYINKTKMATGDVNQIAKLATSWKILLLFLTVISNDSQTLMFLSGFCVAGEF